MSSVFDHRVCELGEGPLWHPIRRQLFWFDIVNSTLMSQLDGHSLSWRFDEMVSAAGWINESELLIASETGLLRFNIDSAEQKKIIDLESDQSVTRSNDGRADPWGGFWIGTMGKQLEIGAGSIYRFYQGELQLIHSDITITNAICFTPDKQFMFFADTFEGKVWRQALDALEGWPVGNPELFIDFKPQGLNPDGAVCDAKGHIWIAFWGEGKVAGFDAHGTQIGEYAFKATQVSCPALGGADFNELFATTAAEHLSAEQVLAQEAGKVYCAKTNIQGRAEYPVIL